MSTYLVAYVVGEYDYVETKDAYGVSMRVYTPVGKKEHGQFAMDVSNRIKASECQSLLFSIDRQQQRFFLSMPITSTSNIPLPKRIKSLFQISRWGKEIWLNRSNWVRSFHSRAMENWGVSASAAFVVPTPRDFF